ncbi:MAG: saccharopine dehydrogenase NADP-binding domain-containing protein [bacterium]
MRIVVFGGAGDMGSEAVRDLVANPAVKSVVIADYSEKRAAALASELGDKAEAARVDANLQNQVIELMGDADAALSCVGPFYKYEEKMVRAAIEAGKNYASICDDFDAAEAVLALDKEAKKAGITVLTGIGWTPGLSNVLARRGIDRMDRARRVNIAWAGSADDSKGLAVVNHTLHIFTGKIPTYFDGKWKQVPAGSGMEKVEFPPPIKKIPVYHLGHPEPVTLPHFIDGLEEVTLKGSVIPLYLNSVSIFLSRIKATDSVFKRDLVGRLVHRMGPLMGKGGKGVSGLRVDVHGEKGKKDVHYTYTCVDNMRRITGIPAAIGVVMMAQGKIEGKGVVAPEVAIDPDKFLKELEKRNIEINISEN